MKRVLFLFGLYYLIVILESCNVILNCDCPEVTKPYFVYENLKVEAPITVESDTLEMSLLIDSVETVACYASYKFINTMLACTCVEPGMQEKYSIEDVLIFSDKSFHDTIPVDSSLTKYFEFSKHYHNKYYPLDEKSWNRTFTRYNEFEGLKLRTSLIPQDMSVTYSFTVKIVNSNNDTVQGVSTEIKWN